MPRGTSSHLQYDGLTLSLDIVHKTETIASYPSYSCLVSEGSVLATLQVAEDMQGTVKFYRNEDI